MPLNIRYLIESHCEGFLSSKGRVSCWLGASFCILTIYPKELHKGIEEILQKSGSGWSNDWAVCWVKSLSCVDRHGYLRIREHSLKCLTGRVKVVDHWRVAVLFKLNFRSPSFLLHSACVPFIGGLVSHTVLVTRHNRSSLIDGSSCCCEW